MLVTVTGAAGRLGREVVRDLIDHGFAVRLVDRASEAIAGDAGSVKDGSVVVCDLRSLPETQAAVRGSDVVVHLAAIPDQKNDPAEVVLANNVVATYNVMSSAAVCGVRRVVYASSQCATGTPYSPFLQPLVYLPVDEAYPGNPIDGYGLSKYLSEAICEQISRAYEITIASLRYPAVWFADEFDLTVRGRLDDPLQGAKSLWSYVDARDAARAVRLAVRAEITGHEVFNIAAETAFTPDVRRSVGEWYGDTDVTFRSQLSGNRSLLDSSKACRLLGFHPRYVWTMGGVRDKADCLAPTRDRTSLD